MTNSDNFGNSTALLNSWKQLRLSMTHDQTDQEHLDKVVEFWSHAPISLHVLDWDQPHLWPNAWNLMYQNKFDENAVALGMFYSLIYSSDRRWNSQRIEICLINSTPKNYQGLILEVDDRWLLNVEYNRLIDSTKNSRDYIVQQTYDYENNRYTARYSQDQSQTKTNDNQIF